MMRLFILFCLVGGVFLSISAQMPRRIPTPSDESRIRGEQEARKMREFERLRNSGNQISKEITARRQTALQSIKLLYRKPNDKELELLTPNKEDLITFANFLRQPNTGLIKIATDKGCAGDQTVVVASSDCLTYTMPGGGSSYSFRIKNYRIPRLSDITFTNNSFQSMGILLHGIFVKIGDVPLEQVNLQTKGVDFLIKLKAEADFQKAVDLDNKLIKGIRNDGFLYRRSLSAVDNTTYLLRSIAYRGKYRRALHGLIYDELGLDKREDVVIAFRIVRRHEEGSISILWKQLAKQDSPKAEWYKNENKATKESGFIGKNN